MILLDTHVFLWWMADDRRLGKRSRQLILSPDNAVQVSAASLWEIAIKHALGRLKFPKEPARLLPKIIADYGFRELAITGKHDSPRPVRPDADRTGQPGRVDSVDGRLDRPPIPGTPSGRR
jgi:PIN domain nuclease of toxin-antitoxin system